MAVASKGKAITDASRLSGPEKAAVILLALGFFMSLGMAAVLKHIPAYYPENVGAVGGVVSMVGGLGGFILPLVFGVLNDLTGVWTSCFFLLLLLIIVLAVPFVLSTQREIN